MASKKHRKKLKRFHNRIKWSASRYATIDFNNEYQKWQNENLKLICNAFGIPVKYVNVKSFPIIDPVKI